jgi:hypothetical protein
MDNVLCSGALGVQNVDAQFFMLRQAQCGSRKVRAGTRYIELVFLNLVRSSGHVVCFGVSGV